MNQLLEIRQNIYYKKEKVEDEYEYKKIHEIVLVLDEPKYTRTNEGNVVRERGCKEVRFAVTADMFENVVEVFTKYKDLKEEDLH
jgi:hypothetical protein